MCQQSNMKDKNRNNAKYLTQELFKILEEKGINSPKTDLSISAFSNYNKGIRVPTFFSFLKLCNLAKINLGDIENCKQGFNHNLSAFFDSNLLNSFFCKLICDKIEENGKTILEYIKEGSADVNFYEIMPERRKQILSLGRIIEYCHIVGFNLGWIDETLKRQEKVEALK